MRGWDYLAEGAGSWKITNIVYIDWGGRKKLTKKMTVEATQQAKGTYGVFCTVIPQTFTINCDPLDVQVAMQQLKLHLLLTKRVLLSDIQ